MSPTDSARQTRSTRVAVNCGIALLALLVFHGVSIGSGKLGEDRGLGWDGQFYGRMVAGAIAEGRANTQTRPLLVLVTRIPHAFGLDIVRSFELMNYVYAFVLYLAASFILHRYGANTRVRLVVVANLALCIATSKMFAFYPVQVDLGALAIITVAFYFVMTDRTWPAAIACVLAAASREFGIVVALCGIHRTLRRGRPWHEAVLAYAPSIATVVLIRMWVAAAIARAGGNDPVLSIADAISNLEFWTSPGFIVIFVYFGITVFGGISALLLVSPRWCLARLREEHELMTFLVLVVALSALGNLDIWRYLAFAVPVAIALIAQYCRGCSEEQTYSILVAMTLVTVLTQRPFEPFDRVLYFREWFPLYHYFETRPPVDGLMQEWVVRLASLVLVMIALAATTRRAWRPAQ